ncbi:MAG TPA: hypothetical protein V6C85_23450 [Allocoleopsis sp.]
MMSVFVRSFPDRILPQRQKNPRPKRTGSFNARSVTNREIAVHRLHRARDYR